ncbi:MAG: ABC transporter ATP-binding protein [Planctomycetaceae bacterium]|nr:ABC transporter ATP-binding protein [Planctomycetaceae bacterium]
MEDDLLSLIVSHISKEYPVRSGSLRILCDCSFELEAGQSLSVVGPSGSGKSTLLSIIGTLEPANSGLVFLDDIQVLSLSERDLPKFRRHKIGFIFQEHYLLPQCTSLENVLIPFLAEGRISKERYNRAIFLLERVGLSDRLEHRPAELSGGERQRVAIARALVYEPSLILADEPTGNLDRNNATIIGDLLLELSKTTMLVMATHDPLLAARTTKQFQINSGSLVKT